MEFYVLLFYFGEIHFDEIRKNFVFSLELSGGNFFDGYV